MSEQRSNLLSNFIVRAIIGSAMIFFINEFLSAQGITVQVGLNPWTVLTSGILGTPGVALLYGISFYGILQVLHKVWVFLKMGWTNQGREVYNHPTSCGSSDLYLIVSRQSIDSYNSKDYYQKNFSKFRLIMFSKCSMPYRQQFTE